MNCSAADKVTISHITPTSGSHITEDLFLVEHLAAIHGYVTATGYFQDWPACDALFRRGLADLSEPTWQVALPLLACQAVGGVKDSAVPVSAAWVAMLQAAHVLDSIQDGDFNPEGEISTQEIALGAVVKLLFAISRFVASVRPLEAQTRVALLFAEAGSHSTTGQHMDLTQDYKVMAPVAALEAYWHSVILKSGSLFRVAAAGGAAVGTDSAPLIEALADYGTCVGVLLQVLDDCRDIMNRPGTEVDELSLPLVLYALAIGSDRVVYPQINSSMELNQALEMAGVPGALSSILLEWRQRAFDSLGPLKSSQAKSALIQIVDEILETASIKSL